MHFSLLCSQSSRAFSVASFFAYFWPAEALHDASFVAAGRRPRAVLGRPKNGGISSTGERREIFMKSRQLLYTSISWP